MDISTAFLLKKKKIEKPEKGRFKKCEIKILSKLIFFIKSSYQDMKMYQIVQNLILCILYMGTLGSEHKVVSQISQKQVGGAIREEELIQKESKGIKQVNTTHRELPMEGGYEGKCNMDANILFLIKKEENEIKVLKLKERELDFTILYEVRLIDYKSTLQILEYDTGWIKKYRNFSDFELIKVTKFQFWRFCRMRKKNWIFRIWEM